MLDVKPINSGEHIGRAAPIANFPMLISSGRLAKSVSLVRYYSDRIVFFQNLRINRRGRRPQHRRPLVSHHNANSFFTLTFNMQAKVTQIKNQSMYINHGIRLLDGTEPLYVLFGRVRERERKR